MVLMLLGSTARSKSNHRLPLQAATLGKVLSRVTVVSADVNTSNILIKPVFDS